jgi:hypothetical protein
MRRLEEKVELGSEVAAGLPQSYVLCSGSGFRGTAGRVRGEGWDSHELSTQHGHADQAVQLTELLVGITAS